MRNCDISLIIKTHLLHLLSTVLILAVTSLLTGLVLMWVGDPRGEGLDVKGEGLDVKGEGLDELVLHVQGAAVDVAVVRWEGLVGVPEDSAPLTGGSRPWLAVTS